jgi:hypothetical protein
MTVWVNRFSTSSLCVAGDEMKNPFIIGQHVRYMPSHRTDGELREYADCSGLSPRKLYSVTNIEGDFLIVEDDRRDHFCNFQNGDLDYRLGRYDNSWEEQKRRIDEKHDNFFKST